MKDVLSCEKGINPILGDSILSDSTNFLAADLPLPFATLQGYEFFGKRSARVSTVQNRQLGMILGYFPLGNKKKEVFHGDRGPHCRDQERGSDR
jgi:hypothetical protein